jgi:hypothetical protein
VRRLVLTLVLLVPMAAAAQLLPPHARFVVDVLGLRPTLEHLGEVQHEAFTVEDQLAEIRARQDAAIQLDRVQLLIDSTIARLQREQVECESAHGLLEDRHEDSSLHWSIAAVIVGNVLSIVGSAMQFNNQTIAFAGDGLIVAGGAAGTVLSIVALTRTDRGPLSGDIDSAMLRPLLGGPPDEASYPPEVWRWLDTRPPGEPASVREELIAKWKREGRLTSPQRITRLTSPLPARTRVDAGLMGDRADMIADVRGRVASMKVELQTLWQTLASIRQTLRK